MTRFIELGKSATVGGEGSGKQDNNTRMLWHSDGSNIAFFQLCQTHDSWNWNLIPLLVLFLKSYQSKSKRLRVPSFKEVPPHPPLPLLPNPPPLVVFLQCSQRLQTNWEQTIKESRNRSLLEISEVVQVQWITLQTTREKVWARSFSLLSREESWIASWNRKRTCSSLVRLVSYSISGS